MEVFIERTGETKKIKLEKDEKIINILKKLDISINSVILVKNEEICLEDSMVNDSDKVKILSVVSGG